MFGCHHEMILPNECLHLRNYVSTALLLESSMTIVFLSLSKKANGFRYIYSIKQKYFCFLALRNGSKYQHDSKLVLTILRFEMSIIVLFPAHVLYSETV